MGDWWDRMACTNFFTGWFDEEKYANLRAEHEAQDARRAATVESGKQRGGIPAENFWSARSGSHSAVARWNALLEREAQR